MLTIQLFINSSWHDAAVLDIKKPRKGRNSQAMLAYEFTYALDYLVPPTKLLPSLAMLAEKLIGLKSQLQARGVPASIINMPGMGFDYLDQRIDSWRLQ